LCYLSDILHFLFFFSAFLSNLHSPAITKEFIFDTVVRNDIWYAVSHFSKVFFFSPTIQGKIKGDLLREDGDGKLEMLHECMTQTTHLDCEHKNLRYY